MGYAVVIQYCQISFKSKWCWIKIIRIVMWSIQNSGYCYYGDWQIVNADRRGATKTNEQFVWLLSDYLVDSFVVVFFIPFLFL